MLAFRSRIFIVLLFLLSAGSSFANIIYVNINNPTPGTGTTWASAYTDLNLALAAANYGDQIWVAQGTYMPTNTSDRTKTFLIKGVISVYGGFTGVETTLAARNWTANQTILSGDIGVGGDYSDDSYNVVTLTNNGNSATLDGFTIQYGNGNQNYPATTNIQPYNQAGGVLVISGPNVYTGALIEHCVLNSNFGVYGGGICTYGYGTNAVIEVNIVHDLFKNNTSIYGGGLAYVRQNGGAGVTNVESCIFNGNISTAGLGSAIVTYEDAAGTMATMEINNNTFYNNPAPLFNNLQKNGGTTNFSANDCIMWQAGGPFASPISIGAPTNIENCDLDLTTPGSGNTNNDPEFVNAPAGNFHLQPCSPDIDADFPTILFSPYDYDGNPRVQNSMIDYGAYESAKTVSPIITATPATYCQNSTASPIAVSGGINILWYTSATGGTGTPTTPMPVTTTVGSTQYWVTQTLTSECESQRNPVTIKVIAQPAAPTTTPVDYCQNSNATALTATGTDLLWYTVATGGTGSIIAPTPSTTTVGSTTWYVSQTGTNACESPRTPIAVTIGAQATAPTTTPVDYCQNSNATALTAIGTDLLWYTVATGGTGSTIAPTPSTISVGNTTWYVSQTPTGSCESPRAPVVVTIDPNPVPDFTWADVCAGTSTSITAVTSTPAPANYTWNFANATSVTGSGAGPYQIVWNNDGNYTVTLTTTVGTCQNHAQHNVTVYAIPRVAINPLATPLCVGSSVTLTASGANDYQWSPATDLSNPAISAPIALLQNDMLYTVTGTDVNGCSATAQILLQISPDCSMGYYTPDAFTPNGDGHNDLFRMKTTDIPKTFSMAIFNRYGSKVFESRDINAGWDGTIGGNPAPTGAYVYIIIVTTSAGNEIKKQGTVMLIR